MVDRSSRLDCQKRNPIHESKHLSNHTSVVRLIMGLYPNPLKPYHQWVLVVFDKFNLCFLPVAVDLGTKAQGP